MFKPKKSSTDPSLFTGFGQILGNRKMQRIEDKMSWDNIYREQVTNRIDEEIFSVLYSQENGRPNAAIRVLVGMMILKEGFGWSDSELYEACRFNLIVMNALGLTNVNDEVPVESTYYEFKKKLYEYQIETGRSLISEASEEATRAQAKIFSVNAKWIRIDSKLIGSNIARCTRLQVIINCLQEFYKGLNEEFREKISKEDRQILEDLVKNNSNQIVYKLSDKEKEKYLKRFGLLLSRLKRIARKEFPEDKDKYGGNRINPYELIERLFKEQYNSKGGKIKLKSDSEISSGAIQSPYDTDATYKKKGNQKVRGYSLNIVETCNKEGLNLMLGAEVYKANIADTEMLKDSVKKAEKICGKVEEISVDGAYYSSDNQKYAKEENKEIHFSGITGTAGDYDFEKVDGELRVTNRKSREEMIAHITQTKRYAIKEGNGKRRYFTEEQIESSGKRKEVEQLPKNIRNVRCNIEASIFQSCFHLRKDKTKYRTRFRNQIWAICRMLWINLRRINNYLIKGHQERLTEVLAFSIK